MVGEKPCIFTSIYPLKEIKFAFRGSIRGNGLIGGRAFFGLHHRTYVRSGSGNMVFD